MAAIATTASAATAMIYKYTYTLGRSLYVPLTSRCNSVPLPLTRGEGFLLPKSVGEALVRVRDAEEPGSVRTDVYADMMDDDRVYLPPYHYPLVNSLYQFCDNDLSQHLQHQREIAASQGDDEYVMDDMIQPSIETLVNEVSSRLDQSAEQFDQVVLAGEGESTLRMDALLAVARSVKSFREENSNMNNTKQSSGRSRSSSEKLAVRVITNGLCYGTTNFGYSPYNRKRNGVIIPLHRHVILRDMLESGISRLSVALNTANRHEYDVLMEPCCSSDLMPGTSHDLVCEFIMEAVKLGMDVEITGIDRPDVDKLETERLARLLLSVGPKYKRRRNIRWRQYFE